MTRPCLKCLTRREPTSHHVYPRRHFPGVGITIPLCRQCHDLIEALIPSERQDDDFYVEVVQYFLSTRMKFIREEVYKIRKAVRRERNRRVYLRRFQQSA
jgi:hypothetical protein